MSRISISLYFHEFKIINRLLRKIKLLISEYLTILMFVNRIQIT